MSLQFTSFDKKARAMDLYEAVQHCSTCRRLSSRTKVLSSYNGNINSKVLFVAEAPGRLGADRTGVPLHGDKTGENFEKLLGNISWRREDVYITNALLCNPREFNGNNDTPSPEEIRNCSVYLEMTIELIQPEVIVSLGRKALDALNIIAPHACQLKQDVARPFYWSGRYVFPLYHPGPRALVHRSLAKQRSDFLVLAKFVNPATGLVTKEKRSDTFQNKLNDSASFTPLQKVIHLLIQKLGRITYFKLTKLLYLIDVTALERIGSTLTGEIYLRQQEGPWVPSLKKAVSLLDGREVIGDFSRKVPTIGPGSAPRFQPNFDEDCLYIILDVLVKYGDMTNSQIKTVAYRTSPMKYILEEEAKGRDMRRVPVIYKNMFCFQLDDAYEGR